MHMTRTERQPTRINDEAALADEALTDEAALTMAASAMKANRP